MRFKQVLCLALLCCASVACQREAPKATPKAAQANATSPPPLKLTDKSESLIFSYSTDGGRSFKTAMAIKDIPEEARKSVAVTDLSLSPEQRQAARYVYLADLTQKRADGSYAVAVASRYGFETQTNANTGAKNATSSAKEVVMYSASWCGVCKKAKRLLTAWGVAFVEKDIEASRSAQQELTQKASQQGINPGGVPVIDVGGILLQGLDEQTLKAALKKKGFL